MIGHYQQEAPQSQKTIDAMVFLKKWMVPEIGVPQNGWVIIPIHLGVPLFLETPKWRCLVVSKMFDSYTTLQRFVRKRLSYFTRVEPSPDFCLVANASS